MKSEGASGLMKIGELAEVTGVNVSTIKFYVKEGLIQPSLRTGKNMSYYHPDCAGRIQLIRSLQKDHYYPLGVIKRMLQSAAPNQMEIELLDAIHKVDYRTVGKSFPLADAVRMTRLTRAQIGLLAEQKLVRPEKAGKKQLYSESDLQIMFLIRRRMDAGIPFDQSVSTFALHERLLRKAVEADVDAFISQVLMTRGFTAEETVHVIGVSDETLDKFICQRRSELNREVGSERLGELEKFSADLSGLLSAFGDILEEFGETGAAQSCRSAPAASQEAGDKASGALDFYNQIIKNSGESLAARITVCGRAHAFFTAAETGEKGGAQALLFCCLRFGWLCLAPRLLERGESAQRALIDLRSLAGERFGAKAEKFAERITSATARFGGVL